jgi:hypothetical protein
MRTPPHRIVFSSRSVAALSAKVDLVVDQYCEFAAQPVPMEAKAFTAHHNACKSALMHLDWLLKGIRNLSLDPQDAEPMVAKIHVARDALIALDTRMDETRRNAPPSPPPGTKIIGKEQPDGP